MKFELLLELINSEEPTNLMLAAQLMKNIPSNEIWDILIKQHITIQLEGKPFYSFIVVLPYGKKIMIKSEIFTKPTKGFKKSLLKALNEA